MTGLSEALSPVVCSSSGHRLLGSVNWAKEFLEGLLRLPLPVFNLLEAAGPIGLPSATFPLSLHRTRESLLGALCISNSNAQFPELRTWEL